MKKLYKMIDGKLHYKEAWVAEKKCTFHWGVVGDTGESKQYRLGRKLPEATAVDSVLSEAMAEGYREIPPEDHFSLMVQYKTAHPWGDEDDLDKRHFVEEILNECLGWTGIGRCDGGDIGSGTINVFCEVVDPHIARDTIVAELRMEELLEGATIAYRNTAGEYEVLWPPEHGGTFSTV